MGRGLPDRVEPPAGDGGKYPVDARGATGVQVGEGNTQIIYTYNRLTWTDGVAPPPLADVSGAVDFPYRGLSAFGERDAALFFGREAAATQVLERMSAQLDRTRLLVVSGVSGAGKSSLLRAGVLPRVRGAGLASAPGSQWWPCLVLSPGRAPLDELALRVGSLAGADAALTRRSLDADPASFALTARQAALTQAAGLADGTGGSARGLLLLVNQFEQLFTQCPDEQQRESFITALHAAAAAGERPDPVPVLVVLVVRADFEARCAGYPQLADPVQDRYLVTAMTERQLRMAITEPAKKAGSRVDDDLTEELLREVRTRHPAVPGGGVLPLLSHALDQAWRCRAGDVLTLADYERAGGIEGAVADSAQRAYRRLTAAQQVAARQVFVRLTATSSDGADTADRASRAELTQGKNAAAVQDVEAVLEAFAAERLLTLAAGTVEISHEILLSAWPLLRDVWLAETHADRIVRTRLRNVAGDWARGSADPSYLYSGSMLATAEETVARARADPARHPPLSDAERSFLHASARARRRRARVRQSLTAALAVLAAGLASLTVLAVRASQEANHQRDVTISGQLISKSAALGDTDPAVSKLESIAAWQISPSAASRYAMLAAAARPGIVRLPGQGPPADSVAFSLDGKTLAVTTDAPNASASFDRLVASTVRLWDVATRRPLGHPLTGFNGVDAVAFSPDSTMLATGDYSGVRLWDLAARRLAGRPLTGHAGDVTSVAFSPDGTMLASGSSDHMVRLWDVATRRPIGRPLTGHAGDVTSVAFSPDGTMLASGSSDHTVRLWDVATRRPADRPLTGHTGDVTAVAFRRDGRALVSASSDGTTRLWFRPGHGPAWRGIAYRTGGAHAVAFSRDQQTMITGGTDGSVRFWDFYGQQVRRALDGHAGAVDSLAVSPDGTTLASGNDRRPHRLGHLRGVQPGRPGAGRRKQPRHGPALERASP